MKIFADKYDKNYRKILIDSLKMEGENGIIKTSIDLIKSKSSLKYTKVCKIDFFGIDLNSLLGQNEEHYKENVTITKQLNNVFENIKILNKQGIRFELRLLLLYPYSKYFVSRIQTENSLTKQFFGEFDLLEEVTPEDVKLSSDFRTLINSLRVIQNYLHAFDLFHEESPNKIDIRFSPIAWSSNILFINNKIFFDAYLLAKREIYSSNSITSPLTMIDGILESDKNIYSIYENQFRYIWQNDSTMYYEDVTNFNKESYTGLTEIKTPFDITFDQKAKKLSSYFNIEDSSSNQFKNFENEYKFKMNAALKQTCVDFKQSTREEKDNFIENSNRVLLHQIASPLVSIRNHILNIIQGRLEPNLIQKRMVDISEMIDYSLRQLNNFKISSEIQTLNPKKTKKNLFDFLFETVSVFQRQAVSKGIKIVINQNTSSFGNEFFETDYSLLSVALENLIDNALKLSYNKNDLNSNILISPELQDNKLQISITNWGHTITPEKKEIISSNSYKGAGVNKFSELGGEIGLYISRKCIEALGGFLDIRSERDKTSLILTIIH